jgi:hypothetical protein
MRDLYEISIVKGIGEVAISVEIAICRRIQGTLMVKAKKT